MISSRFLIAFDEKVDFLSHGKFPREGPCSNSFELSVLLETECSEIAMHALGVQGSRRLGREG